MTLGVDTGVKVKPREARMRIGELARRSGVSTRSLRYYEGQGLLTAGRTSSGYRDFPTGTVETVAQIRSLLAAGFTVATIRQVLPCMDGTEVDLCPRVAGLIRRTLSGLEHQLTDLEHKRDRVDRLLSGRTSTA